MNLRCTYCQTPFTIGRAELLAALQRMDAENLHHYDAHCPRCRKANSVARQRMEMVFPNWRQAAQEQAAMSSAPAPVPTPTPVPTPAKPESEVEKPVDMMAKKPVPSAAKPKSNPVSTAKAVARSSSKGKKTAAKSKKKS